MSKASVNILEQAIQQGQKLRNNIVETILEHDPFYINQTSSETKCTDLPAIGSTSRSTAEKHKFLMYMRGEDMSSDDEKKAMETFRSISNSEIVELTGRSFKGCCCDTCREYNKIGDDCGVVKPQLKEHFKHNVLKYLKFVDSLKVAVSSFKLSDEGCLKVNSSTVKQVNIMTMFFIEYKLPTEISKHKNKLSKVDSGLDTNKVHLCSKKTCNRTIYFKHIIYHDVSNLYEVDLNSVDIVLIISSRLPKQRKTNIIGYGKFNLGSIYESKYLSCNQNLAIMLNENTPIKMGTLNITFELGCGRLYFGKDFLDSLSNKNKENTCLPETEVPKLDLSAFVSTSSLSCKPVTQTKISETTQQSKKMQKKLTQKVQIETKQHKKPEEVAQSTQTEPLKQLQENIIVFGFIYISQVEYLTMRQGTFITCRPFCQGDIIYSNLVNAGSQPFFNFYQKIPYIYSEDFISKFRDNYMLFEFWEKIGYKDEPIGVCKISLHQYYLAFRNSVILTYLCRNKLPVIGTDWYEPISDLLTGEIKGQVQILIALGTEEQINNLEYERGFRDQAVIKAKKTFKAAATSVNHKVSVPNVCFKQIKAKVKLNNTNQETQTRLEQENKSIQSDVDYNYQEKEQILSNLLKQAIEKSEIVKTDTAVNTEMEPQVRSTSELLDSLTKALNINIPAVIPQTKTVHRTFKCSVTVESALHLPYRKKTKKVKQKHLSYKSMPSTYVTFESENLNKPFVSKVVSQSASPKWNFSCEVDLPVELLSNNQKRLVFKVWKKSCNNPESVEPNMKADTVIGFAAVDLTALSAGLPTIHGWFNVVDFAGKCNGQINVNIAPIEDISQFTKQENSDSLTFTNTSPCIAPPTLILATNESGAEETGELLSRALKRKFTELDEITQRLRARLSNVTHDESDTSNDDALEEFENDINTAADEDDNIDPEDFILLSKSVSEESSSTNTSLDTLNCQLQYGKQRIDSLLQKLTLISVNDQSDGFSSRYVSGCSVTRENTLDVSNNSNKFDDIFNELGLEKQPFDANKMFESKLSETGLLAEKIRDLPDGEGTDRDK